MKPSVSIVVSAGGQVPRVDPARPEEEPEQ